MAVEAELVAFVLYQMVGGGTVRIVAGVTLSLPEGGVDTVQLHHIFKFGVTIQAQLLDG